MLERLSFRQSPRELGAAPLSQGTTFVRPELGDWYSPVLIGADVLGASARSGATLKAAQEVLGRLTPDSYTQYMEAFYRDGQSRFGEYWQFADITTALLAAAQLARPTNYLEIGVRRGRSMAVVCSACPECAVVGFDMWIADYAGIENPGPDFVRSELNRVGHTGRLEFIDGNSHETVPAYFNAHPDAYFDLITVDGDHSRKGAIQDLRDVIPRLTVGGILVFDDIAHPAHPELAGVWHDVVASDARFSSWTYDDVGYGVAIAVRKA